MSYYCSVAGTIGEIIGPKFNPDGTIREGIVVYVDTEAKIHMDYARSFCFVPPDFKTAWSVENPPAGAHMYIEGTRLQNGFARQQILDDAEDLRNEIQNKAQAIAEGGLKAPLRGGQPVVDVPASAPNTNAPAGSAEPVAAVPDVGRDPRDTDGDGTVTKEEAKEYKRKLHELAGE